MVLLEQKTCVNASVFNEVYPVVVKFSVKDIIHKIVLDIMGQRGMSHSNQFMNLGAERQSQPYIYPDPCVMYGSYTAFPHPNYRTVGNFYVPRVPGHQEGAFFYGMSPTNGIQQWHHFPNVGTVFAPPSNYFYPYMASTSSYTAFPVPVNHGIRNGLPVSGTQGSVGNNADNLGRNDPRMDSTRGSSKQMNVEGNPGNLQHPSDLAGPSTSAADGITTAHEYDVSSSDSVSREHGGSDSAPLLENSVSSPVDLPVPANHGLEGGIPVSGTTDDSVSREHGGSDSALNHSSSDVVPVSDTMDDSVSHDHGRSDSTPLLENGVQRIGSRFASGQTTVLQNNNNHPFQGNYVGQAYQFPGNPWLNMPFNSSSSAAQSWAWSQAAPSPYPPGGAGGYAVGGGNMGMQSYQVFSNNWGLTSYLYPPIPQGPPQYHPHLPPNMQRMAGHTMSSSPLMTASPGRQLQLSSSNMGTLQPSAFTWYRPHQRESMHGTSTSHHNRPNGGATLGVPWYRGVGISIDRHRDMRLDVDHMSYEELLALTERIGNVTTGLSEDIIDTNLRTRVFLSTETPRAPETVASQDQIILCVICQNECKDQEKMGILDCGHEYHEECIKQWLVVKNTCCICKSPALRIKKKGKGIVNIRGN